MFAPGPWYAALDKPPWTPPPWVFAPAWTALYVMMAAAAWRIWLPLGLRGALPAFGLFAGQLAVNALWSPLFFGLHKPGLALLDLSLLLVLVAGTVAVFVRRDRLAGVLLLPYLLWAGFAWVLNFSIWRLNT